MTNAAEAGEPLDAAGLTPLLPLDAAQDDEINAGVASAGLLPLLMASVHITGKLDILRAAGRTQRPQFSTDMSGSVAAELATALRQRITAAIRQWRDDGAPAPYLPAPEEFREMIEALTGKALDQRYEALLAEELGFHGDERAFAWKTPVSAAMKQKLPVMIVGAGLSGLVMGYRLLQAGVPFTIVEKNSGPGGTWFENRFPGARVDVPSPCYSYSFFKAHRWPELFSPWPVLRDYFTEVADRFGLTAHIRYSTAVARAVYDSDAKAWDVTLSSDGGHETTRVSVLISAVGQLNRPLIPEIEGQEAFAGRRVHTSHWPSDLSVAGKNVAVIGTAATAIQLIPELAKDAKHLTVFQRSPTWVFVHPEYRRAISAGEQWAIDHLPGYGSWARALMYNWADDGSPDRMRIDPAWPQDGRSVSAANEASRIRLTGLMETAIGDSAALREKLIPKYPPYVKRPNLGDGGYFRAMSRDNVSLNTDGVARFTKDGIIDGKGAHHDADIVVYATGFKALEYLAPMEIVGRTGKRIEEFWGDEPRAYLGITAPEFPNLFLMYGPGTNLGYNGNLFFNAECQARYIASCIGWMVEDKLTAIEVKPSVYQDYAERMDQALANFTWSHGSAGNWYKNKAGKVIANSPWPLLDYWSWTRAPNPDDFTAD